MTKTGTIPLVTICHNNHHYVENTISQATKFGLRTIVVDNASTYAATRIYLRRAQNVADVIYLAENLGHLCWSTPAVYDALPERFFISDPDLQWNPSLPPDFPAILDALCSELGASQIGFALDLSDWTEMHQDADYFQGQSIRAWEEQFWRSRLQHPLYELYSAPIDTTFHLFDKANRGGSRVRVAGVFTARHLPWYRDTPIDLHDLLHMYAVSRGSTTSRLALRQIALKHDLRAVLEECKQKCGDAAFLTAAKHATGSS